MNKEKLIDDKEILIVNNKMNLKKYIISTNAITLISLVITIIILILLAGIAINISIGENGIFRRAKEAKEQYALSIAREKLEIVLLDAGTQKETNKEYSKEEFLNKMLEEKDMEVQGNNVIVDNYIFVIDREKLEIIKNEGKTNIKIIKEVKSYNGKNEKGKYEVEVSIKAEGEIQSAKIEKADGSKIEIDAQELKEGKHIALELDEEYTITITTKEGKEETRKIIESSEETIRTAKELAEFRDKVNTGLTYDRTKL